MQDLKRRAKRISGIGLEIGLGVFLVAMLLYAWKAPSTQATPMHKHAGRMHAAVLPNAQVTPTPATLCIQDEATRAFITLDRTTGAFNFNNCRGTTLSGFGTFKTSGVTISFQSNQTSPRAIATDDEATHRATATVTLPNNQRQALTDRDTRNNTCGCGPVKPPAD
jgi:hypothetical protein